MDARELPARPSLEQYKKQAKDLVKAFNSGDPAALRRIGQHFHLERLPSWDEFRASVLRQLKRYHKTAHSDATDAAFALADSQFLIARAYAFESWPKLKQHVEALTRANSPISQFERAADAIITGDVALLMRLLRENPALIRARSTRQHRAALLHYVSANGIEDFRQKTPNNIVEITKLLLNSGADVEAVADSYGGSKTLDLVATSIHPARAGVQIALMETLLAAGAAIDGFPEKSVVNGCLANGRPEAAEFLARRGARLDIEGASGVGRIDIVMTFFNGDGSMKPNAVKSQVDSGFMWACEFGHNNVIQFLLDKGLDVATEVQGMTGLHWAMVGGHAGTVRLLLDSKAPLGLKNCYGGTALGCATWAVMHSDPVYRWPEPETDWAVIVQMLLDAGARIEEADYPTGNTRVDELLRRHGAKQ
jgi:ankyrin repeat protein